MDGAGVSGFAPSKISDAYNNTAGSIVAKLGAAAPGFKDSGPLPSTPPPVSTGKGLGGFLGTLGTQLTKPSIVINPTPAQLSSIAAKAAIGGSNISSKSTAPPPAPKPSGGVGGIFGKVNPKAKPAPASKAGSVVAAVGAAAPGYKF